MSKQFYHDWAKSYGPRSGLNHNAGAKMLAAFVEDLERAGVTSEELALATEQAIKRITERPPQSLSDHRAYLFRAIENIRASRSAHQERSTWEKHRDEAAPPGAIRQLLLEKGLLTDRYRKTHGLPTLKEQKLQEQIEVPEEERGDAWEPPGVAAT